MYDIPASFCLDPIAPMVSQAAHALDVATGSLVWSFTTGPTHCARAFPCHVQIPTLNPFKHTYPKPVQTYQRANPEPLHTAAPVRSTPALAHDGTIYVGSQDSSMCVAAGLGFRDWELRF
jgi:hypothetical protein